MDFWGPAAREGLVAPIPSWVPVGWGAGAGRVQAGHRLPSQPLFQTSRAFPFLPGLTHTGWAARRLQSSSHSPGQNSLQGILALRDPSPAGTPQGALSLPANIPQGHLTLVTPAKAPCTLGPSTGSQIDNPSFNFPPQSFPVQGSHQ